MGSDLYRKYEKLIDLFEELKYELQRNHAHLYERWKLGGFIVSEDIVSMYPNLSETIDLALGDDSSEKSDEEEGNTYDP